MSICGTWPQRIFLLRTFVSLSPRMRDTAEDDAFDGGVNRASSSIALGAAQPELKEKYLKRYLAYAGALTVLTGSANAAYAADGTGDSLTWYGITLYGTIDVG